MTIKQKQWQLYYLGYYGGQIDGIWGERSKAATKKFQTDNGLEADGIFGEKTEAKSKAAVEKIQKAIGMPQSEQDGLAGHRTKEATRVYQSQNGLDPDGIAGVLTRARVGESEAVNWDTVKYFARDEFRCKCGGKYCGGFPAEVSKPLVDAADTVREHFGVPVTVSSGIRCQRHNANVGGVANSRHLYGKAMDFCVRGQSAATVLPYIRSLPQIRYAYAIDANYVHMDVE